MTSRTSLVTAAAIAGVLIAGTAAVAANIGILNAADSSTIGDLTATDELLPTAGADIDTSTTILESTTVPSTTVVTVPDAPLPQRYDIESIGSVWVTTTTSGIALDHIVAEPAWTPLPSQGDLRSLRVDFTSGDRTIVFTAALADDGSVVVDVTEPTTVVAAAPASTGAQNSGGSPSTPTTTYDDRDDDRDDDHDDRDDDDEDDDHEDDDREDDDRDEYEGADDDD
jgi:hypothetical protein